MDVNLLDVIHQVQGVAPLAVMAEGPCDVVATSIDLVQVEYECPFCWTRYKTNGEPTARAKRGVHRHGSEGSTLMRVLHRVPHCANPHDGVRIHVTEETAGAT